MANDIRLIAFYLPQFHAIPENDAWWGKGFTEWTNVKKAKPLFPGHYQPRIPADEIGYYDLSDSKTLEKQVDLARQYGLHGFCFYHYWFKGKLLLEKPLESFLRNKDLDFNFCLCWANEPWSRRWHGQEEDVLQGQNYGDKEGWVEHIKYLLPFLKDKRAITIEGKPIFLIYRIGHVKNANEMISCWREEAKKQGLPSIYVVSVLGSHKDCYHFKDMDIDAACEFVPMYPFQKKVKPHKTGNTAVYDYDSSWRDILNRKKVFPVQHKGAFASWDNTPRSGEHGFVWQGSTPKKYKFYLKQQIKKTLKEHANNGLIFINAWNEWAESCYLEPDKKYGRAYLEATKEALQEGGKCGVVETVMFKILTLADSLALVMRAAMLNLNNWLDRHLSWRFKK